MAVQGSPEWFNEKSKTNKKKQWQETIEDMRESFIERFSPEKLAGMDGNELLKVVFGNDEKTMIHLLMYDKNYRSFGAPGKYKYLEIVYQKNDGEWCYKESSRAVTVSYEEAVQKAEYVRDMLMDCIDAIKETGVFETIQDYKALDERMAKNFIYKYAWVIKYYQMIFPQFFAGMYADSTLDRALNILGLPNHGKSQRLINVGELSLFIRKCDVNNIVFNKIYEDEWDWGDDNKPPCKNAAVNYEQSSRAVKEVNTSFYRLASVNADAEKKIKEQMHGLQNYLDERDIEGAERESIVRTRVNQGVFRDRLIRKYGKCCLCGVSNTELLIAGHIKPWASCDGKERVDDDNGILLCPNHDKLFDKGYISFDDDGRIMISTILNRNDSMFMNVNENMKIDINDRIRGYLEYHRKNVFKK